MCLTRNNIKLLLTGKVDKLDGVSTHPDGEVSVLFFLWMLHTIDQFFYPKDIHI